MGVPLIYFKYVLLYLNVYIKHFICLHNKYMVSITGKYYIFLICVDLFISLLLIMGIRYRYCIINLLLLMMMLNVLGCGEVVMFGD